MGPCGTQKTWERTWFTLPSQHYSPMSEYELFLKHLPGVKRIHEDPVAHVVIGVFVKQLLLANTIHDSPAAWNDDGK